jgi:hypothetical protein
MTNKALIRLRKAKRKGKNKENDFKVFVLTPEAFEKRRKEAIDYLLKEYSETRKRREELQRKLQNYGPVKRWLYIRAMNLKTFGMILKETILKPVILCTAVCSGALSIWLGTVLQTLIAGSIDKHVAFPFNYILNVIILFPTGFSPAIISIFLSYFQEKKKIKRMLENYGILV